VPATGGRFANVDEICIFRVHGGKLVSAFGVDKLTRFRRVGIAPRTD
jgi:hypothetical protein